MALSDQIERFSKAPLKHKALGLVAFTVFFGAVFYFLFYSEMDDKEKALNTQLTAAKEEEASYLEKERKYLSFRSEVNRLLEEKKELVKVLPTEAEIPSFLAVASRPGRAVGPEHPELQAGRGGTPAVLRDDPGVDDHHGHLPPDQQVLLLGWQAQANRQHQGPHPGQAHGDRDRDSAAGDVPGQHLPVPLQRASQQPRPAGQGG